MRRKLSFLAEASKILSSSLDYNKTLSSIADLVVNNIADFCIIDLLKDDGTMHRVAVKIKSPKQSKLANQMYRFPPDPKNKDAIYECAQQEKPILIRKATKKWLDSVSLLEKEHEVIRKLRLNSHIFVPLKSRGRVIGVLTFASQNPRFSYKASDLLLAEELANRSGIAVDNARLYSEAQDAIQARDEFLSIASHELKTPLTSILLHLQTVLSRIRRKSSAEYGDYRIGRMLESTERQTKKLAKLINDLLNISIVSTGRLHLDKERVSLGEIVEDVIDRFKIQLQQEEYSFDLHIDRKVVGKWDKVRIEQIVSNLLSNAIKYGEKRPIHIVVKRRNHTAQLVVQDEGIGIDPKRSKEIFGRFKRGVSNRDYSGLGVGLYISKQIAEAHGGKIKLNTIPKRGSTFTVELPLKSS
ncbi:MAG: GAF domain-containing sensor histidine kinase [Candidatus Levybacteria bacterium]|nr:GAF domain-containing sensor histidine kinase [Candidatus Levybacteria bacterium]